jgi:hypothetical protein
MTSQVIRTLEQKGLVTREVDAADLRARRLVITACRHMQLDPPTGGTQFGAWLRGGPRGGRHPGVVTHGG